MQISCTNRAHTDTLKLAIQFVEGYPERSIPTLDLISLSALIDSDTLDLLKRQLIDLASASLGMPMVFTLASHLKERLDELALIESNRRLSLAEEKRLMEEEAENAKFRGTPVSRDSFMKWMKQFKGETAGHNFLSIQSSISEKRLTGREIFESDKDKMIISDRGFAEEGEIAVDVSLFEKELDISLESDDDESDEIRRQLIEILND